jgi:hypothetical protein
VVAQGDNIGPGMKNLFALLRGHAYHVGIFAVDHCEADAILPLNGAQLLFQKSQSGSAANVSHGQNTDYHGSSPQNFTFALNISHSGGKY